MTQNKLGIYICMIGLVLLFASCSSTPEVEAKELTGTVQSEVLEHKGSALGLNELPTWVETYILKGITGLESLSDFADEYCFVAETTATNLNAAQAWVEGFDIPQTIAQSVSTRVESVFSGASSSSDNSDYGTYFENVVKTMTDTEFSGARKENDWWVLTRRYDTDSKNQYTDEYRTFVLYTIPKDLLDQQILAAIDRVDQETVVDSEAAERVRDLISTSGL